MPFPQRLLNEGEQVVVSTRTHPKALILPVLGLLVGVGVVVLSTAFDKGGLETALRWAMWVVAAALLLGYVLPKLVVWWTTTYTFTNRRFIKRSGFIAKVGRTIPLNRISGVDFEIGVIDRIFGCGTLVVADASDQGRVELHDIPRVEQVQKQVAEQLHRLAERRSADDGA